jgi:hypothetical protein
VWKKTPAGKQIQSRPAAGLSRTGRARAAAQAQDQAGTCAHPNGRLCHGDSGSVCRTVEGPFVAVTPEAMLSTS